MGYPLQYSGASLVAQMVKNMPAMQETWDRSLGWENSLEEGMATPSSILAWRIPRTEEAGCSPLGRKDLDMTEATQLAYKPPELDTTEVTQHTLRHFTESKVVF